MTDDAGGRPFLVVCVGNRDRGDDAVGPLVADLLRATPIAGVDVRELAGDSTALLQAWVGADDVIVVDAVLSGAPPGTVHVIDGLRESPPPSPAHSTHGFGVAEAIALGRALDELPTALTVFGVEGADFTPGAALSPPVARAAAEVAARIRARAARA
jgi:hydrogenase maturation protease